MVLKQWKYQKVKTLDGGLNHCYLWRTRSHQQEAQKKKVFLQKKQFIYKTRWNLASLKQQPPSSVFNQHNQHGRSRRTGHRPWHEDMNTFRASVAKKHPCACVYMCTCWFFMISSLVLNTGASSTSMPSAISTTFSSSSVLYLKRTKGHVRQI